MQCPINSLLIFNKKIISLRVELLAHIRRLTQPLFIEVSVQIQYRNDGMASNERRTIFLLGLPCVRYWYSSSCFISWSTLQRVCTPQTRNCFIFLYKVFATAARDQSCLARPQMTKRQGVALSISVIVQNVWSGTVVGNVLGVCYAGYALKIYIFWFSNKNMPIVAA